MNKFKQNPAPEILRTGLKFRQKNLLIPFFLLIIICVCYFSGCFHYSFSGAMTGDIRTVSIPLFENQTAEYGFVERITDDLILVFQKDNTLKIVDESDADAILRGTLIRVEDVPYTYEGEGEGESANFSVGEYKLTLVVNLEYYNQKKGEVIWTQKVEGWGTYEHITGSPDEREAGFTEAIEKMNQDILNLTVSGW